MTNRRVDNRNITFSLKKEWFDLIKSGDKTEEYREIRPYWANRLVYGKNVKFNYQFWMGIFYKQRKPSSALVDAFSKCFDLNFAFRNYDSVTFTCGYPKKDDKERRITFKNPHIRISEGKTEWGAKAGRKYFVISWEDRI